jgi:hypothetical protein
MLIVSFLSLILARTVPFMLTEIYIEALRADEEFADLVWEVRHVGLITDDLSAMAWAIFAIRVGP